MITAQRRVARPSDKLSWPFGIHAYEGLYERILSEHETRCPPANIKLLEIGLGPDGAARSMVLYQTFSPRVEYYGLEYDDQRQMIQRSRSLNATQKNALLRRLVIGDQSNTSALREVMDRFGDFDVIVDDGSHMTMHQMSAFEHLFVEGLRPGGTYIVEDLQTSFHPAWGGGEERQGTLSTMVGYLQQLMVGLHFHWWDHPDYNRKLKKNRYGQVMNTPGFIAHASVLPWVASIECQREICAVRKRADKLQLRPHSRM